MREFLLSIRLKTLPASIGPVLVGASLSYPSIDYLILAFIVSCALLMQISSNLINDYYDFRDGVDKEGRLGTIRSIHKGDIEPGKLKTWFQFTLFTAFLFGLYLSYISGFEIFILGVISLFFAWAYTGGPLPLSRFFLGEVLAFIFFGPIAVVGTVYILKGEISTYDIYLSCPLGIISALLMGINNLRDYETDSKVGKKTLASFFGERVGKGLNLFLVILSLIWCSLGILFFDLSLWFLLTLLPGLFFIKSWKKMFMGKVDSSLNFILANTGKYLFLMAITMSGVIVLYGS